MTHSLLNLCLKHGGNVNCIPILSCSLNETGFIKTTISDKVCMIRALGQSDKASLLKHVPEEDKKYMAELLSAEKKKGAFKAWYNCPLGVLSQVVFQVWTQLNYIALFQILNYNLCHVLMELWWMYAMYRMCIIQSYNLFWKRKAWFH